MNFFKAFSNHDALCMFPNLDVTFNLEMAHQEVVGGGNSICQSLLGLAIGPNCKGHTCIGEIAHSGENCNHPISIMEPQQQ